MENPPAARTHLSLDVDEDVLAGVDEPIDEDAPVVLAAPDDDVVDEDADLDPADKLPKHAVRNVDGSVTLPLRFPQSLRTKKAGKTSEKRFETLTFHRLNGADQRAVAAASDDMQNIVAFARALRINQAVMNALWDKMDASDLTAGGQVINNFFASGRTTGKRSSAS